MPSGGTKLLALLGAIAGLLLAAPATASAGSADIAALQVAMNALGLYPHPVDGISGPWTQGAVRTFQSQRGLAVDGVAGPQTRAALGRRGKPIARRSADEGGQAWLGRRGAPVPPARAGLRAGRVRRGVRAQHASAVRRFQGLHISGSMASRGRRRSRAAGNAGGRTSPIGPVRFFRPVPGAIGDRFGWIPPGRWHTGLDFPEPMGTPIHAGGVGVVSFAGFNTGGYGNLVVITHRLGFESWYAHMSRIAASVGQTRRGRPDNWLRRIDRAFDRPAPALRGSSLRNPCRPHPLPPRLSSAAGAGGQARAAPEVPPERRCARAAG